MLGKKKNTVDDKYIRDKTERFFEVGLLTRRQV